MKNMKKLLGAMAALGFSTVAAVNVVACSNPTPSNDLTKSFETSYTTAAADATVQGKWGLSAPTASGFTFTFASVDADTLKALVKPKDATVPVQVVTKEANKTTFPNATKAGEELAQITKSTADGPVTASGDKKTVAIKFTLKLWKATEASKTGDNWVDQTTTMDVTVNIDTAAAATKVDISTGSITDPGTFVANTGKTYADLNNDVAIGTLVTNAINAIKSGTDAALNTDFTLTNDKTGNQAAGIDVTFTVAVKAGSAKLIEGKTFDFTITLQASAPTTVDISTASVTDPGTIDANTGAQYSVLNTNPVIGNLVKAAINVIKPSTDAALGADFTLTNDKTGNQVAGTAVKFTVAVAPLSSKLTQGKTFQFTITLKAPTPTTVDISGASVTDPGDFAANTGATYGNLNTNVVISNLVIAAINAVQAGTNPVLTTDFTLTNDQTPGDNQVVGTNVKFTVVVAAGSLKLTQGKTFEFTINLK